MASSPKPVANEPASAPSPTVAETSTTTPPAAVTSARATPQPQTQPTQPIAQVEVDDDAFDGDGDSALGDDVELSTASISSSILRFRQENGRTYHAYRDGKYLFPNDEKENDRLDLQHHVWLLSLEGRLGYAPPAELDAQPGRVLDAGTGTGIWAIDFGDEHPQSTVIGVDLSPIQPSFIPPNVHFQIDDLEDEWTFTEKFDYIHIRVMSGSIADWPEFFKKCYDNLAPGGWVEVQELGAPLCDDGTYHEGLAIHQAVTMLNAGLTAIGRGLVDVYKLKNFLIEAGFPAVEEKHGYWPSNAWPKSPKLKEIGTWANMSLSSGFEGFLLALGTRDQGWSPEEVTVLAAKAKADMNNRNIHTYWPV